MPWKSPSLTTETFLASVRRQAGEGGLLSLLQPLGKVRLPC